jgi:hypothetical protein
MPILAAAVLNGRSQEPAEARNVQLSDKQRLIGRQSRDKPCR